MHRLGFALPIALSAALSACISLAPAPAAPPPAIATPLPPTLPAPAAQSTRSNAPLLASPTPAGAATAPAAVRVLPTNTAAPSATPRPLATPLPTATPRPTATAVPPVAKLRDAPVNEKNEKPRYDIEGAYPAIAADVPGAQRFNDYVQRYAQLRLTSFKTEMETWDAPKDPGIWSALRVSYSTTLAVPGTVSVLIEHYSYYAGAAHPNADTVAINWDLASGEPLTLESQFKPGANGLKLIADYSTRELRKKLGRDLSEAGASPKPENYARWNLTPKGILVTFDAYQVAAYAVGPQEVLVPRSALANAIAPGSALDRHVK